MSLCRELPPSEAPAFHQAQARDPERPQRHPPPPPRVAAGFCKGTQVLPTGPTASQPSRCLLTRPSGQVKASDIFKPTEVPDQHSLPLCPLSSWASDPTSRVPPHHVALLEGPVSVIIWSVTSPPSHQLREK